MRFVIQRVTEGSVSVGDKQVASIGKGYVVLVGIMQDDSETVARRIIQKLVHLRIMSDDEGKMNKSIKEVEGEILFISQFTLCADMAYGRRPSFTKAMDPEGARRLYDYMTTLLKDEGISVKNGSFGNYMSVSIVNDGPVTIILEE